MTDRQQTPRKLSAILQDAIDNHHALDYAPYPTFKKHTLTEAIIAAARPHEGDAAKELITIIRELVPQVPYLKGAPDAICQVLQYQYDFGIDTVGCQQRWFSRMFAISVIEYLKSIDN